MMPLESSAHSQVSLVPLSYIDLDIWRVRIKGAHEAQPRLDVTIGPEVAAEPAPKPKRKRPAGGRRDFCSDVLDDAGGRQ